MDSPTSPAASDKGVTQDAGKRLTMARGTCPRCGRPVPARATGRPATWCSQVCRRSAYEERRAAANGAVAVQVVDRVNTVEHDLTECMRRVAASPAACRRVLRALTQLARDGALASDPKWDSTVTALRGLNDAMYAPTGAQLRRW